jgi:hypothetical protein
MKLTKLPDSEQFYIKPCILGGDECILIHPKEIGIKWTDENKIFRSSIWTKDTLTPVSLGFRKFPNLGEQPDFEPFDSDSPCSYISKIDGSCLIVSVYNGELIVRTRGTVDAYAMENGYEIDFLKTKYPWVFDNDYINSEGFTLLLEWETPTNYIVIRDAKEPTLTLIGIVDHSDYSYFSQDDLDVIAMKLNVARPERYEFPSFQQMLETVANFKGKEGVVIYSQNGANLKKVKALDYLKLHRMKSNLKSENNILDLYISSGCPVFEDFEKFVIDTLDFEVWEQIKVSVSKYCEMWKEIQKSMDEMKVFVHSLSALTRKEQASIILEKYPNHNSVVFTLLSGKEFNNVHKLFEIFTK